MFLVQKVKEKKSEEIEDTSESCICTKPYHHRNMRLKWKEDEFLTVLTLVNTCDIHLTRLCRHFFCFLSCLFFALENISGLRFECWEIVVNPTLVLSLLLEFIKEYFGISVAEAINSRILGYRSTVLDADISIRILVFESSCSAAICLGIATHKCNSDSNMSMRFMFNHDFSRC